MSLSRPPVDDGEYELIKAGFGKYTRAAYRIGRKYPRYAAKLLRQGIHKDTIADNAAELADVVENAVVPAFEGAETAALPAATEALEAVSLIAAPEVAALVAVGGLAFYLFHKMTWGKKNKQPKLPDFNKIRIGTNQTPQKSVTYKPPKIRQPVATGEVIRGAAIRERSIRNGLRVNGREVIGTTRGAVSTGGFTLAGAFVATPLAYPGSRMGVLSKTYAKYNIRKWNVRVITASPTTDDGQILTYFHHNRHDPFINWTSTGFITTVLSGQNAVVGPKWQDSHLPVSLTGKVLENSFPMGDGHMDLGAGDTLIYTRSSSADSYIVMCEYEIDFTEPQIMSRINLVPFARAQWLYVARGFGAYNVVINTSALDLSTGVVGGADGTANSGEAQDATIGDIYRFVVDIDNSVFTTTGGTTITPLNFMNHQAPDNGALTLRNGTTLYVVKASATFHRFYPTLAAARLYANHFRWGLTGTGTVVLTGWQCLVDSMEGTLLQSSV